MPEFNRQMSPEAKGPLGNARLAAVEEEIVRAEEGVASTSGPEKTIWEGRLADAQVRRQKILNETESSIAA